ncbi:hypothetical protein AWV79_27640 [Cupriavidus sp. UYMMa02A]|nr:hypothetical protein AWV79_27640 [Cupriavidus sp. UYMMa02A]
MTIATQPQAIPTPGIDSADLLQGYEQLQKVSAGMNGVLALLEQQCETSEACFSVYCLVGCLKEQMEQALERIVFVH